MPLNEPFAVIGVKPNSSYFHNTMRIVVLFMLILIIVILYYSGTKSSKPTASINDINNIIRPGTKMYDAIMDMDADNRIVYIASISKMILNEVHEVSKFRKIFKTVFTTLIVGFVAEYVIHGNITKVVSITGKTGLSAALAALA